MDCAAGARGQGTVELLLVSVLVTGLLFFGVNAVLKIRDRFKHHYSDEDYKVSTSRTAIEAAQRIEALLAKRLILFDTSARSADFGKRLEAEGWTRTASIVNGKTGLFIFLKDGCQFTVTSQIGMRQCGLD
jgi:hypothetical protein